MDTAVAVWVDPELVEQVRRAAAAGGAEVELVTGVAEVAARWVDAPLVLLGPEQAVALAEAPTRPRAVPGRRGRLVLLAGQSSGPLWASAVAVGADYVAVLPEAEPWLVARLADAARDQRAGVAAQSGPAGVCLGVVGGRGGAGASVLSVGIALTARRRGLRTALVDADALGGGLDLLLGWEEAAGLRWSELAQASGSLPASVLYDLLPGDERLCVVSYDRQAPLPVPETAMVSVLEALAGMCDLVVVDVGRVLDAGTRAALSFADRVLLVVPAEVRACAAAERVRAAVAAGCRDLQLVVRSCPPGRLPAAAVADALRLPLAACARTDTGLPAALERGELAAAALRGPLARVSGQLLDAVGLPDRPQSVRA